MDFKSIASADSAIAPARDILPYFEMSVTKISW
jgi:hypothetical protein